MYNGLLFHYMGKVLERSTTTTPLLSIHGAHEELGGSLVFLSFFWISYFSPFHFRFHFHFLFQFYLFFIYLYFFFFFFFILP
jgi:hypothetical protein